MDQINKYKLQMSNIALMPLEVNQADQLFSSKKTGETHLTGLEMSLVNTGYQRGFQFTLTVQKYITILVNKIMSLQRSSNPKT